MKRTHGIVNVGIACALWLTATAAPQVVHFDTRQAFPETRLELKDLGESLATDWSDYEALVLEFRASGSQRIHLKIHTGPLPEKFSHVLLHPYAGAWVRAAIPVAMLSAAPTTGSDMASVGNRSRTGYYLGLWGPFVPLKNVTAISFSMENPIGSPRLEIRSVRLAKQSPGDAVLEPLPLVDEFGQWIPENWPGKVTSSGELKAAWAREEASLGARSVEYCPYGGYQTTKVEPTRFFRVEQIDGKWWFVDPDGHLFLSAGCDVMNPESTTPVAGREEFFKELPPAQLAPQRLFASGAASFFTWNLERRFGTEWREAWRTFTFRRMDAWGLNTIGNWSDRGLWDAAKKPYAMPLAGWRTKVSWLGLPDVYADEFESNADAAAREQCAPRKNDPFLLGYFLANEPPFPQKEQQTAAMILAGPDTATQRALRQWLANGDTPQRRKQFIDEAFDRYIQVTSRAVKKHDPNHLNLGMRSGGRPTEAELRVSRAFDVYSVNVYDFQVGAERMRKITELTGKPTLIGEFHFGVPGRGLAASLVQVKDQRQRGVAYRYYVEQAFAMPGLIGTHWFQWVDQPSTGRFDGENYNIGLVDITDRPYEELVEALKTTHARLYDVHAGRTEPFAQKAHLH